MRLPTKCPKCQSVDFSTEHVFDEETEEVHQQCDCAACLFTWVVIFSFTSWYTDHDP